MKFLQISPLVPVLPQGIPKRGLLLDTLKPDFDLFLFEPDFDLFELFELEVELLGFPRKPSLSSSSCFVSCVSVSDL